METLKLSDKLQLLKIRAMLKLNQIIHRNQLSSHKSTEKFGPLENITKYLGARKISLRLYKKDEGKKAYILELIELLRSYGIDVELIELEQIFNNEDMRSILEKNPNTEINLRYVIGTYVIGNNVEMKYGISDYCQILDKIEYLSKVTRANFKNEDEQVMFVITQLANYISFYEGYKKLSNEELKVVSSLKSALLKRKTVCIGYAMILERCLTDLGIECNVLTGIASGQEQANLSCNDFNHAWTQIKSNNKWYNVDLSFFSESGNLEYILADDKTFKGHYVTGTQDTFSCNSSYSNRREIYDKVKNIKNVLVGYDSGKRDTMLQYDIASDNYDAKDSEQEKQVDISQRVEYHEEK